MPETTCGDLVAGLRGWTRGGTDHEKAAVELLTWHGTWLRRPDFRDAAITWRGPGLIARIDWHEAREFVDRGYFGRSATHPLPASTSERAVLDLAVALGEDRYRLSGMGHAHRRSVANAVMAAVGLGEVVALPEPPASALPCGCPAVLGCLGHPGSDEGS